MKELLELKEKTENEISLLYSELSNPKNLHKDMNVVSGRYLDKIRFLELINIIYTIK